MLALVSVSSSSLVVRYAASVPAVSLAFWRMFLASGMLWVYSIKKTESLSQKNKSRVVFAGMFLGLHFIFFFIGVREVSVANATLLANTGPFFTALFSIAVRKPIHRYAFLGLVSAMVGILVVQGSGLDAVMENFYGNFFSLLSGVCIAITYIFASKIRKNTSNVIYGRSLFLVAALTIAFVAIIFAVPLFGFSFEHFCWFLFLGLVPTVLGHNVLNYVIKYLTPTAVASVPLGEPVIASVFAYFLFSELIPVSAYFGAPFIFVGIYLILKNSSSG